MSQAISAVDPSWRTSPLTNVRIALSRKSHPSTSPGPIGQRVSAPFTRSIDPASVSRKSCKPKSLAIVYPAMNGPTSLYATFRQVRPITIATSPS